MAWIFRDEQHDYALTVLDQLGRRDVIVPPVWPLEVANALCTGKRRLRLERKGVADALTLIESLDVTVDSLNQNPAAWYSLACDYDLTPYDAAYVDLARRAGAPLATLDMPMRRAARKIGVSIFQV